MSLIISDSEPSGNPNRSVTARPSSLPLVINGVPDTSRLHKASFGDNLRWYLELPWPSETEPSDVQWVIIRSDGTEYAGHVPEGIPGPLSLDDLLVHHGWSNVVPPGHPGTNPLPPEVFIFQGPVAPIQDMNPPKTTAVGEHSLIISDSEPSGLPGGRSVTARPSSLPLSINGVPDISRFHVASFADNLRWYLALPWPSETDPGDIQWIVIRSDGTEYAGHIPEGIRGPLTLDDLVVHYGWGVVVPPPLGPIEDNLLPTVGGEVSVIQGPMGPAPVYDLYANRPSASAAGDRTLFVATDLSGGTLFEVQTLLGAPTWVQIGIGALDARLSDSRTPILHAPTHGSLGSDPVALDAGQITSGVLDLARLSGLSHSQLDASAGILGTQIHDVPVTLLTGLLGAAQGGLGLNASGALARELLLGTGDGAFTLGFLAPGDIPGLDASKIVSGTLALSRLSGITGAQLSGTAGITSGQIASVAASTLTGVLGSAQFSLVPGDIPGLDASKITSGTLALGRLSGITTNQLSPTAGIVSSQIASVLASTLQGTINSFNLSLVPGDIPGLDASKITSGTFALGRLSGITGGQLSGTAGITAAQIASVSTSTLVGIIGSSHLSLVPGDIPGLDASKITTGVFTTGLIPSLNAAKITSGTLALARGGTGLDSSGATNGQLLIGTGSGFSLATLTAGDNITITTSSGGITIASIISSAVTSVGLIAPSEFSVSGSPVTGAGTLTLTKLNQNANLVYAGPTTGSPGAPTFRYLVSADIPTLPASRITGGQLATARGGTGLDTSSAANGQLLIGTGTGLALATLTAGTGITITNTSGHIQIDGATTYTLPIASASVLGGIKVGSNLAIDGAGVLSGTYSYSLPVASTSVLGGVKQGANVTIDGAGVLSVAAPYSLPIATTSVLGGVKQGSNITIDGSGIISVAAPYSLPTASASVLGGIKVGSGLSINGSGILSVTGSGSGTVTSVDMTAPSEITVTGSPVTSSGTIALTWASETQHFVFAGPSGSSGTPGFRALLASDIPALGYVTSVALTVPADFGISGSPITSSGTLGLTWNAQTGNVVMASPSGGGSGTPGFRSLVAADLPSDVAYVDVDNVFTVDQTIPRLFISDGTKKLLFRSDLSTLEVDTNSNNKLLFSTWSNSAFGGTQTQILQLEAGVTRAVGIFQVADDITTPTKGYRFRTVGSALDLEFSGTSLYISGWTGADFTGTQEFFFQLDPSNSNMNFKRSFFPDSSSLSMGLSTDYWLSTYSKNLYLNATAQLDGTTAGLVNLTGNLTISGTLGLPSQTQHYVFAAPSGSSGVPGFRALVSDDITSLDGSKITGSHSLADSVLSTNVPLLNINNTFTSADGSLAASSGVAQVFVIDNTVTQSGTAGYIGLKVNVNESSLGSGTHNLLDLQVGYTSKFAVTNSGSLTLSGSLTASSLMQTYVLINPTIAQSGSASYTALSVDVTESSTGSGTSYLLDLKKGGVSQLQVQNSQPHMYLNTSASSTSFPTTIGMADFGSGNAARFQFGDENNCIQNSFGGSIQLTGWWGIELVGNTQGASPSFHLTNDAAVLIYTSTSTDIGLRVRGTTSQSGDLQQWQNSTPTTVASISASGGLTLAGSLTLPSQTQHQVFAAPSGSSGVPGFRALIATDIPALSYVTSVAMTVPADFGISGSAITSSGTLGLTWNAQTGNVVMASPSGGGSGTPTFRSLVSGDIPSLDVAKITTGTFATSFIPNLDTSKITTGTFSLARLSGITTTELSATAGIVAGQIASVNPSVLTGSGTVPSAALPTATASTLGAIKIGTTLSIASGVLDYTLPTASASVLGGIKVGSGLSIDGTGVLSSTGSSPLTTKGDLWSYDTSNNRLPVGSNNTFLVADSSQTLGLRYRALVAGDVTAVNPSALTGSGTIPQAANTPANAAAALMFANSMYA